MKYKPLQGDAEIYMRYQGVHIYETHPNDNMDEWPHQYLFVLKPWQGEAEAFDVRDVVDYRYEWPVRLNLLEMIKAGSISEEGVKLK